MTLCWAEYLECGIPLIDQQHQKTATLFSELYQALEEGRSRESLQQMLETLLEHMDEHAVCEEELLGRGDSDLLAAHRHEHQIFLAKLSKLVGAHASGGTNLTAEVVGVLRDWQVDHFLEWDQRAFKGTSNAA